MATPPLSYRHRRPRADTTAHAPAIILLHGRGADETDLLPLATSLPDTPHLFSLRAPHSFEDGYAWYYLAVEQGGLRNRQPDADSFSASLQALTETVSVLVDSYPVDNDRVGLLGFSQGGTLALGAVTELAARPAWIAGLHAYVPAKTTIDPLQDLPVFLTTGERDLVVSPRRHAQSRDRLTDAGAVVTHNTYPTGHTVGETERADLLVWLEERV